MTYEEGLYIRLTAQEKTTLKAIAQAMNMTVSALIRLWIEDFSVVVEPQGRNDD